MEGTRLVDRAFQKGASEAGRSFHTASFVILRVTHARSFRHFDIGSCGIALGFVCDGATCTTGPAFSPQFGTGPELRNEDETVVDEEQ